VFTSFAATDVGVPPVSVVEVLVTRSTMSITSPICSAFAPHEPPVRPVNTPPAGGGQTGDTQPALISWGIDPLAAQAPAWALAISTAPGTTDESTSTASVVLTRTLVRIDSSGVASLSDSLRIGQH